MTAKKWLVCVAALATAICVLVAGVNFMVDPWGLNEAITIDGFNVHKPDPLGTARLHKAYAVMRLKPAAVAMGTSTAEHGINMQHPAWRGFGTVYNLSFPGATIVEIKDFLREAHRTSPVRRATIGLELFSFNAHREASAQTAQAVGAMRSALARVRPYFTGGMLADAFNTVLHQASLGTYFLPNGQSSLESFVQWRARAKGHHNLYAFSSRKTVRGLLLKPKYRFEFQRGKEASTLDQFRELLEFARQEGIELKFFFSPYHAWQLETIRAVGLWSNFEYWKQQLALMVDAYSQPAAGGPVVTLWDFADYSAITTEAVSTPGDIEARMRWSWDGQHYTTELGDLLQDRMSGLSTSAATLPDGYGVRLDAHNVNAHLLMVRERQKQYHESHPADVAEVEAIVTKTLNSLRTN